MKFTDWAEEHVSALQDREETVRLEFKSGKLLESTERLKEKLARTVSAFANTEGGELVLGVGEKKVGKRRLAGAIDGCPADFDTHRLQQMAEEGISPALAGMRVRRVQISGRHDRVIFVIQVPQGHTAYQASDRLYYGRSECETKPLADNQIRVLMLRGVQGDARVECSTRLRTSAASRLDNQIRERQDAQRQAHATVQKARRDPAIGGSPELDDFLRIRGGGDAPDFVDTSRLEERHRFDEHEINLAIRNVGAKTLRMFVVQVRVAADAGIVACESTDAQGETGFQSAQDAQRRHRPSHRWDSSQVLPAHPSNAVLSGDQCLLGSICLLVPEGSQSSATLSWTVLLEDAYPVSGVLELRLSDAA